MLNRIASSDADIYLTAATKSWSDLGAEICQLDCAAQILSSVIMEEMLPLLTRRGSKGSLSGEEGDSETPYSSSTLVTVAVGLLSTFFLPDQIVSAPVFVVQILKLLIMLGS